MAGVRMIGMREIKIRLTVLNGKLLKAADDALLEEGRKILAAARPDVPVDTGATRESGFAERRGPLRVQVGYQTFYAPIIHVTHREKGGWFGSAAFAAHDGFAERVGADIRKRLGIK